MNFNLRNVAVAMMLVVMLLAGCSSTEDKAGGFVDETAGIDKPENGVTTQSLGDSALSGSELNGGNGANGSDGMNGAGQGGSGSTKTIYFMYDSSQVMEEFVPVIAQYAQNLKANPSRHLVISGHTDERGSREYNVALGEQRAKTVERMLTLQGVSAAQIETVSYGEEKPASEGHDESAWQLNRRAELDYQGQ